MGTGVNIAIAMTIMCACLTPDAASAKQSSSINRPENSEAYSTIGDVLVKVTLRESLPNAFGGADIFGRKRDRGFVEIRYMGLTEDGRAVFRRRSADIYSNETTMSRTPMRIGSGRVTAVGNTAYISTVTTGPATATVQVLPPDTFEIALDLSKSNIMTVEDRVIEILSADSGGVRFIVRKQ